MREKSDQSCVFRAELFHFALFSSKRLPGHLSPDTRPSSDSQCGKQWEREAERAREQGGCVLRQGISVFQPLSRWFPAHIKTLIPPCPSLYSATVKKVFFRRVSHLGCDFFWVRFVSHFSCRGVCVSSLPFWYLTGSSPVSGLFPPRLTSKRRRAN